MFSLIGKRILVTGASSGIGKQIAVSLSNQGAILTILGRDTSRLDEVKSLLSTQAHQSFQIDLINQLQVKNFVKQQTPFDGIVMAAGVISYLPAKFISEEKIDSIFDVNYKASVLLLQQLIKNKLINKGGSVAFISSISAKIGIAGTALYASSKAALISFAKVVASELAGQKIRSNCICPGIVVTPMTENASDVSLDLMSDAEKEYPLGYGTPEDVAGLIVYLMSDSSRWMTGAELILDGGFTLK